MNTIWLITMQKAHGEDDGPSYYVHAKDVASGDVESVITRREESLGVQGEDAEDEGDGADDAGQEE